MQFKNPEFLYLLFLLIIPILIHLFQLQKFQKVAFTNVKILKKIEQQTRKSSKLKKLLILLSRLFIFASLIFAFSQPFIKKENNETNKEIFIYLDNSFSMQAKGESGALLQKAKNDLIENLPNNTESITLVTNNQIIKFKDYENFKNEIIPIGYYPIHQNFNNILFQIQNLKNKKVKSLHEVLLISDFQKTNKIAKEIFTDSLTNYSFVQILPDNFGNIAIDSVWVNKINNENILLNARIKSYHLSIKNLSISLYLSDKLHGKTTINLQENEQEIIEFSIPNKANIHGYLRLNDNKLKFDNTLYFNIPNKEKTNVLTIGENAAFLNKIYTSDEFNYNTTSLNSLDYSTITKQHVIILNNIDFLPNSLINTLGNFIKNDGDLVVIPANEIDITSYNNLFKDLMIGKIISQNNSKKSISKISYEHPFFKDVFKKHISNFQYPTVESSFETKFKSASYLLQFEDKTSFITEIKSNNAKIYWVASSLRKENSNFIASPLVVPVFYNFSLQKINHEALYNVIGDKNEIIINFNTDNQEVLHMVNDKKDFIPLQSKTSRYTKINTDIDPLTDGIYQINNKEETVLDVAYNYNRNESDLNYFEMDKLFPNTSYFKSVKSALIDMNDKNKNLWQLFIIFALLFLGLEILFQKFLKY